MLSVLWAMKILRQCYNAEKKNCKKLLQGTILELIILCLKWMAQSQVLIPQPMKDHLWLHKDFNKAGHHSEEIGIDSRRKIFRQGQYIIDSHSVLSVMEEFGTFVINQLDNMRASRESISTFDMLVRTITNFSLNLIEGISNIVAEWGMLDNNAAEDIPPVLLPLELFALSHRNLESS